MSNKVARTSKPCLSITLGPRVASPSCALGRIAGRVETETCSTLNWLASHLLCYVPVGSTLRELDSIGLTGFCHKSKHRLSVQHQKLLPHPSLLLHNKFGPI